MTCSGLAITGHGHKRLPYRVSSARSKRPCAVQGHSGSLAVPDVQSPLGSRPSQRACSAKCRAALSRDKRESARKQRDQQIAELLRVALQMVEDR